MTGTVERPPARADRDRAKRISVRRVAFLGLGAMVGAGIFALLGQAGAIAGSAAAVLAAFSVDTLESDPATFVAMVVIALLAFMLDRVWERARDRGDAATRLPATTRGAA